MKKILTKLRKRFYTFQSEKSDEQPNYFAFGFIISLILVFSITLVIELISKGSGSVFKNALTNTVYYTWLHIVIGVILQLALKKFNK